MNCTTRFFTALAFLATLAAAGCHSPYHADRGALFGGLTGAGVGAIIGDSVGNAAAGTAIGAGVGALTGAAVGQGMDDIEARNRALIEQKMGRRVVAGAVTIGEVVSMTAAGVDDELIVNHVRAHGMARPLQTDDLIALKNQGVSTRVIKAMQEPPPTPAPTVVRQPAPAPVIVEEYHYGAPYWGPAYHHYPHRRRGPPRVGWGMSFYN